MMSRRAGRGKGRGDDMPGVEAAKRRSDVLDKDGDGPRR